MADTIEKAVNILKDRTRISAFTGAGISVESGIPPFRGNEGIWSRYDPSTLEISYFLDHPLESWKVIREIFYSYFDSAKPNKAHQVLARMEMSGRLDSVITQNIDNLHQEAGSRKVIEFHGNSRKLICLTCQRVYRANDMNFEHLPPTCHECGGLLKPDFVFFGEGIPQSALIGAYESARKSEVMLVIGTTGEVMPANQVPLIAKQNGALIIEINPERSNYTDKVTDLFLRGKSSEIMGILELRLFSPALNDDQHGVD